MVAKEYMNFEPKTKIPVAEFTAQQREQRISLTHENCLSVENALREYERLCYLTKIGEGRQLPGKLRKLEDAVRCLKNNIEAIRDEEGYIWEYLLDQSEANLGGLEQLLVQCEALNSKIPKRDKKQIKAQLLNRLLNRLAEIYTTATGKPARISKGAPTKHDPYPGGRGGRFAQFLRAAVKYLPDECRPAEKTIRGIGSRFDRMKQEEKAGKTISPNWIGLPYPALARSNWKENQFRRVAGKRP